MEPKIDPKTIKSRSWGPLPRWCWPFGRQRAPQGGVPPPKGAKNRQKCVKKTALRRAVGSEKNRRENFAADTIRHGGGLALCALRYKYTYEYKI